MKNINTAHKAPYIIYVEADGAYCIINPHNGTILASSQDAEEVTGILTGIINQWIANGHEHASYIV